MNKVIVKRSLLYAFALSAIVTPLALAQDPVVETPDIVVPGVDSSTAFFVTVVFFSGIMGNVITQLFKQIAWFNVESRTSLQSAVVELFNTAACIGIAAGVSMVFVGEVDFVAALLAAVASKGTYTINKITSALGAYTKAKVNGG